jgi:cytochrome c peroxidase
MQHTENLDMGFRHMDGTRGVAMTDVEKEDLLNFLNTLNDETFVKKQLLSEPGGGFVIN